MIILDQLNELKACRDVVLTYEEYMQREKELRDRDQNSYERAIEVEKRATSIAEQERDLAKEQADFYKQLYEMVTKKPGGIKCFFKKFFTLWIGRC